MEPQSKRRKCGDEAAPEIIAIAFGGPMYDEATARKMLKEVVRVAEDEEFGIEAEIGFDPDDAALDNVYFVFDDDFGEVEITPMIYFAQKGDAKMCRYLISRGASTTKSWAEENDYFCPIYAAADGGHLEICNLLYANGAQNDVRRRDEHGYTSFHYAAYDGQDKVVRWLTLHGALCSDDNTEEIEGHRIYPDTNKRAKLKMSVSYEQLIEWAKEVTQTHSALVMFLLGTLPPATDKDQSCTLQCLSGLSGARQHIGDFLGLEVTKEKHLCILRQVADVLPSFIIN